MDNKKMGISDDKKIFSNVQTEAALLRISKSLTGKGDEIETSSVSTDYQEAQSVPIICYKPEIGWNFGEYLGLEIVKKLGFEVEYVSFTNPPKSLPYLIYAVGGLLNNSWVKPLSRVTGKVYVWGSGVSKGLPGEEQRIADFKERFEVCMVRGCLTAEYYGLDGVLIGDPSYLASCVWQFPNKTGEVLHVQFYYDKEPTELSGTTKSVTTLLSNPESDFLNVLEAIATAKFVLSGSMHGALTAHSYGVPWAIAPKSTRDPSQEWKWQDVCSGFGLEPADLKTCHSYKEGRKWWASIKGKIKPITPEWQQQIIEAFPS